MSQIPPVITGSMGLGNYAGFIFNVLVKNQNRGPEAPVKFTAVCSRRAEQADKLKAMGIKLVPSLDDLLNEPVEAVWLPVSIPQHRPFTEQALAAGKAVMVEKPLAATIDDADAMIAARDKYKRPVAVGYQDMYDPTTVQIKNALLDGAIGEIKWASITSYGARGDKYYNRADWPGKIKVGNDWVLDSPANNAHAHGINLAMFLLGSRPEISALPVQVEAELYRANPIENYDTISMRLTLDTGVPFLVLQTHACEFFMDDLFIIQGTKGRIYRVRDMVVIETPKGSQVLLRTADIRDHMVERFTKLVRGIPDDKIAVATLETARAQTLAINGASEASVIHPIPESVTRMANSSQGKGRAVIGMEARINLCGQRNLMMHESKLFPWTVPAGKLDLRTYKHFKGPRTA